MPNTPVDVSGLTSGVSAISVGENHSCAVLTTGALKCWGRNAYGQLGDNSTTDRNTSVNVNGLTSGVSTVSGGEFHTCALLTTGGLKCWGRNTQGQLGDNTTTQRNTPVDVSGLTSGVSAVSAGGDHTCARTVSGGAKCWGDNQDGQIGDGTNTDRLTPVDVSGLTGGVSAVSSGGDHVCALLVTGVMKCWGGNPSGQLGDGTLVNTNAPITSLFASSTTYTADTAHKHAVASLSTGETYTYDANGNMTQRVEGGLTYTQTFDAENRLISVAVSGQTTQFIYDGDGNLVKKINPNVSKTLYVGGIYEVDKASGGSVTRTVTYYPVASAMRIDSTLYYVLKDHLGSASVVTNASGTTVGEQRYYPFGETRLTTGTIYTDKLFTGQREMTGLGIYHYQARFYSPKTGRFLSADTIVPSYANPQNLNRYGYVLNNPLRYIDPTGHVCTDPEDPNPTCYGTGTTRVGNRMIRGIHAQSKNKPNRPRPSGGRNVGFAYRSFQMFQVTDPYYYGQSANESFTDFPGGGDPNYAPQVYVARNNRIPKGKVGDLFGLGNDFLLGYRPTYLRNNTPYDQGVLLTYETTFQNTPSVDAVKTVTLTSITIHNSSNINSVIHYSVYVSTGRDQMSSDAAAGPGQSSDVPLSGGLEVYDSNTGFGLIIQANTGCVGPCITTQNAPLFQGSITFNLNP